MLNPDYVRIAALALILLCLMGMSRAMSALIAELDALERENALLRMWVVVRGDQTRTPAPE